MRLRVQVTDVHRKSRKTKVISLVMKLFLGFLGASRACAIIVLSISGFGVNEVIIMKLISRSTLMQAHAFLAAFILPVAILFFVTGALYTWGIKGNYDVATHELHLSEPIQDDLVELVTLAKTELIKQDKGVPSGQAKVKRIGSSFRLEWTGASMDVILEPTSQPLVAKLEIKQTNWHRQFVQLHKAKGGDIFKVYATVFAIALLLLLVTGFIMAWQMPKLRKLTLVSTLLGIAVFIVVVAYS